MGCQRLGEAAKGQEYFAKATNWVAAQTSLSPDDKAEFEAFRAEAEAALAASTAK